MPPWLRNCARVVGQGGTWPRRKTSRLVGQVITGGTVSRTMMTWVAVLVFRQRSTACHILVMMIGQVVPLVVEVRVAVMNPSQLSNAVTMAGNGTSFKHWKFWLGGTPTSCGGIVSTTVMSCVA